MDIKRCGEEGKGDEANLKIIATMWGRKEYKDEVSMYLPYRAVQLDTELTRSSHSTDDEWSSGKNSPSATTSSEL